MSAFQTILTDRELSYTPGGTIVFDSPVTFTQPVNIPGGVSEQVINVDTINPFTALGPVTVTTNLIVDGSVSSNTLKPQSGTLVTIPTGDTLAVNSIEPASGSTIAMLGNVTIPASDSLATNTIIPDTGSTVAIGGNVAISPSFNIAVNTVEAATGSNIAFPSSVVLGSGFKVYTDSIDPSVTTSTTFSGNVVIANTKTLSYGTGSILQETGGNTTITTPGTLVYSPTIVDFYAGGSNAAMTNTITLTTANTWYVLPITPGSYTTNNSVGFTFGTVGPGGFQIQYTNAALTTRYGMIDAIPSIDNQSAGANFLLGWFINPTVNGTTGLITGVPYNSSVTMQNIPAGGNRVIPTRYAGLLVRPNTYVLGIQTPTAGTVVSTTYINVMATSFSSGND